MKHIIEMVKIRSKSYPEESFQDEYQHLLYKIIGNSLLSGDMSLPSIQEKREQIVESVEIPDNLNEDIEMKITGNKQGISGEKFDDTPFDNYLCKLSNFCYVLTPGTNCIRVLN